MMLFVIANAMHMKIGVQVVIEDYVYDKNKKLTLVMLNNFFAWAVGARLHLRDPQDFVRSVRRWLRMVPATALPR